MDINTDKSKLDLYSNNSNFNKSLFNSQSSITNINQLGNLFSPYTKISGFSYPINNNIRYFCPECNIFPNINYINEYQIEYTCKCPDRKNIRINIDELFVESKKYLFFDEKTEKIKIQNKELICKCPDKKKFKYYCTKCDQNLCKYCCDNHFHGGNEANNKLIVFDFYNTKIIKIIEEIIAIIITDKNIFKIEKKFEDNTSKVIEINTNNKGEKIKKTKENLDNFHELIEIIIFDYKNIPNFTHFKNIENIYNFLINQKKNTICKIKTSQDHYETGFFCNILFENSENELKELLLL